MVKVACDGLGLSIYDIHMEGAGTGRKKMASLACISLAHFFNDYLENKIPD